MKRYLFTYIILLIAIAGSSQNTLVPSVSNYHLTWTTINPAFSGFRDAISVSSLYRSALYGELGPKDMQLNVHTPLGNSKVAIGGIVAYNNTPPDRNLLSIMSTYAYRIYLGSGRLSFGLSAGVYGENSDLSVVSLRDPGDPSFPSEAYQRWFPNFGTGVLYYTDKLFVGLSVPELLSIPRWDQSIGTMNVEDYRFILTGAYLFDFSRAFRLKPSVMIDYNQAFTSVKASLNVGLMDSRVFVGGAYDHPNYAIALLNFQVNSQWLLGYAYTISMGPIRGALGGSHEVVLRWEFKPVIRTIPDDPFYF
ncbi:MAG: type IX secretion system membrane protein PorP/SprF [Bacteroidales bacterium]|nr:type IX secretion system membrane protein PorP/SprF [Bacteroidales bacterium]